MARSPVKARDEAAAEGRTRGVLEIVTAILLGLVSVATAFGAYQAGQWGQEASAIAGASQQLRDRNLALFLERENIAADDFERLFDAIGLSAEASFYPEREEAALAEQEVVIAAASPALVDAWDEWEACGFCIEDAPVNSPLYEAEMYAAPQSYNLISAVADKSAQHLLQRSYTMTIVSVVFAIALLLLGVAGVSSRLRVSALTTGGGAIAFLVGVAIVIFGVF
jgi:small-conductance mechanosensitive channel